MRFTENHKMGDVISDQYRLLLLLSRFGIPLGFGDKTVKNVCADNGVDVKTFLAVANYVSTGDNTIFRDIDMRAMVKFLKLSHQYYIDFLFPELRIKLSNIVADTPDHKIGELTIKLFDSYVSEVRKHLEYESRVVFGYAERLMTGESEGMDFDLESFIHQHENIDSKLTELKSIMIKYYPAGDMLRSVNQVLFDIFTCEEDLMSHCDIEDNLFIPAVIDLENRERRGHE